MVSDIKADSCYLTWDAPEDNGGSDISNYIVEFRDASKKKSDFDVMTVHLIDRRYTVSEKWVYRCSHLTLQPLNNVILLFLFRSTNWT